MKRWFVLIVCVVLLSLPAILAAQQTPLQQAQAIKIALDTLRVQVDALIVALTPPPPPPPPVPTLLLAVAPAAITLGSTSTVTWSSTNTTGCTKSGDWTGTAAVSGSLVVTPNAVRTWNYMLVCTGVSGSASQSVALIVNAVPPPPPPPPPPTTASLTYLGKIRDVVTTSGTPATDGALDATFRVTLATTQTVTGLRVTRLAGGEWNTFGGGSWCLGAALSATTTRLNTTTCAVNFSAQAFDVYASDSGNAYFVAGGIFTLMVTGGPTPVTLTVTIAAPPPPPPPPPPPTTCDPAAGCVINPARLEFDASPDHAALSRYLLEVPGAFATVDLGLPTPNVAGRIDVPVAAFATIPPGVLFTATITAVAPTGQALSIASNTFLRTP